MFRPFLDTGFRIELSIKLAQEEHAWDYSKNKMSNPKIILDKTYNSFHVVAGTIAKKNTILQYAHYPHCHQIN